MSGVRFHSFFGGSVGPCGVWCQMRMVPLTVTGMQSLPIIHRKACKLKAFDLSDGVQKRGGEDGEGLGCTWCLFLRRNSPRGRVSAPNHTKTVREQQWADTDHRGSSRQSVSAGCCSCSSSVVSLPSCDSCDAECEEECGVWFRYCRSDR